MSRWIDQYKSHAFSNTWQTLKSLSSSEGLDDVIDTLNLSELARLRKVISHIDVLLQNLDPEIFPISHLNTINSQVQSCTNQLNSFKGNHNIGNLSNANNNLDQVILVLHQYIGPVNQSLENDINKATINYSDTVDRLIKRYTSKVDEGLSDFDSQSGSLGERVEQLRNELKGFENELNQSSKTIQQQIAEFNTQYQSSEQERKSKFDKVIESYEENSDRSFEELTIKSSKIIEVLVKLQDDASKVYDVTINTLQGGAYSSYANEERNTANSLRYLAGFLMLLAVGFLVVPEIIQLSGQGTYEFDWKKMLGRIPLSLVVFVPAFYLARESGKHRNNEISNRRRQHILSTLDPYIELMDSEKAQELKAHVAKTVFSEASVTDEPDKNTSNLISQLTNFAKQIKG